MKRWRSTTALLILAVLLLPVLVRQLLPPEPRALERVALADTRHVEIAFRNRTQNLALAGMLFLPDGDGPFPAAVVIHGSGSSHRNNGWYLTLAKHLQDSGIAVLLPDKRGSEKSEGDWRTSGFEDLATDTLAAIDYLRTQDSIVLSGIGLIGMSQGGWIAPLVAAQDDDLAFIVSMVGSAVTPREQLLYEENHNIRQLGVLPGISNVLAYLGSANVRYLAQPELYRLIVDYDPLPYWADVSIDSLALFGADDTNVPSVESAQRLSSLRNPNIRVKVYEGSGHALESPRGHGNSIIRSDVLEDISAFIHEKGSTQEGVRHFPVMKGPDRFNGGLLRSNTRSVRRSADPAPRALGTRACSGAARGRRADAAHRVSLVERDRKFRARAAEGTRFRYLVSGNSNCRTANGSVGDRLSGSYVTESGSSIFCWRVFRL